MIDDNPTEATDDLWDSANMGFRMNGSNPHDQLGNPADSHLFIKDLNITFETPDGDMLEAHIRTATTGRTPGRTARSTAEW